MARVTSTAGMGISSTCQTECATPAARAMACSSTEKVMMMRRQPLGAARCSESIASNAMREYQVGVAAGLGCEVVFGCPAGAD
jgi:hypothetical protein